MGFVAISYGMCQEKIFLMLLLNLLISIILSIAGPKICLGDFDGKASFLGRFSLLILMNNIMESVTCGDLFFFLVRVRGV